MDLKRQAVSGARWTAFSTVAVTLLQLLQYVALARLLTPNDFGLMAMLLVVISFSQVYAELGISEGIVYRQDTPRDVLSSLYWLNVGASLVVTAAVMLAAPAVALIFNEPRVRGLVIQIAPAILVAACGRQSQVLLQKELRFKRLALVESAAVLGGFVVAVVSAVQLHDVIALILGYLVTTILRTILLLLATARTLEIHMRFSFEGLGSYVEFGFWQVCEKTVNFLSERADQLIIGVLLGAGPLGYYNLAYYLVVQPTYRINPILTRVAFPVFARVQDSVDQLRSGYLQLLRVLAYVNFPMLAGVCAVAGSLVPVVFGPQWRPAVPIVQILAIVMLFRSVGNPIGALILATGRVKLGFEWTFMLTAIQLPTLYVAARWYGIVGVAASLVAIQLVLLLPFYLTVIRPLLRVSLAEYFGSFSPFLLASGLMGVIVYLLELAVFKETTLGSLSLAVIAGVLIQGALYLSVLRGTGRQILDLMFSR